MYMSGANKAQTSLHQQNGSIVLPQTKGLITSNYITTDLRAGQRGMSGKN